MPVNKNSAGRAAHQSAAPELPAILRPAKDAAAALKRRVGRFENYEFLEAIYRVYIDWTRQKVSKRSTRKLADELEIVRRKGMSPIRILIEATLPETDFKQKSRWVRALEYIYSEDVPPSRFRKFVRAKGGLAGCARLAAQEHRKRRRPRLNNGEGDWDD